MLEPRPHRPALGRDRAAEELRGEVRAGRLDGDAAEAVLAAAGQPVRRRREHVASLTAREIEVLRLVARGLSIKEIGRTLTIAPKTADAHIQHIYAKVGVSTRAAATLATSPSSTAVNPTQRVHDTATVTGNKPGTFPTGTVTFFLCQYAVGSTTST